MERGNGSDETNQDNNNNNNNEKCEDNKTNWQISGSAHGISLRLSLLAFTFLCHYLHGDSPRWLWHKGKCLLSDMAWKNVFELRAQAWILSPFFLHSSYFFSLLLPFFCTSCLFNERNILQMTCDRARCINIFDKGKEKEKKTSQKWHPEHVFPRISIW